MLMRAPPLAGQSLTPREIEIIELSVNTCLSNRQIGSRLGITSKTVDAHRDHAYNKLDVHCIQELCKWYWTEYRK